MEENARTLFRIMFFSAKIRSIRPRALAESHKCEVCILDGDPHVPDWCASVGQTGERCIQAAYGTKSTQGLLFCISGAFPGLGCFNKRPPANTNQSVKGAMQEASNG